MFTTHQLVFALCALLVFTVVLIFSYRKDRKLHQKFYKGSLWILVGFILFVALLFAVKTYLKP